MKVNFSCSQQRKSSQLIKSDSLSLSIPSIGNGKLSRLPLIAAHTHFWALFFTSRVSFQPVAISVISKVKQKFPLLLPPSWPTRSILTNPGRLLSQSAQVRIGFESLSSEPGLVWESPLESSLLRSALRRRSMVAGALPRGAHKEFSALPSKIA